MKIFGLYIKTRRELDRIFRNAYDKGYDKGVEVQKTITHAALNPVVFSLKELRQNTWDVERVDHAIKWLESCYD